MKFISRMFPQHLHNQIQCLACSDNLQAKNCNHLHLN